MRRATKRARPIGRADFQARVDAVLRDAAAASGDTQVRQWVGKLLEVPVAKAKRPRKK